MSLVNFPTTSGRVELGPKSVGHSVMVDGRCIPRLKAIDRGDDMEFILDGRFSYTVPAANSEQFASAIGNAIAIGAGWPCLTADARAPFAPKVAFISLAPAEPSL